ncbi:MAG: hypothetical protein K1X29_02520 [Bdellovibrionales bacterium]|nr:hypothetical protein [Bdellovibrionales bacterium]
MKPFSQNSDCCIFKKKITLIILFLSFFLQTRCALFDRRSSQKSTPEIRDLPMEARDPELGARHRILVLNFLSSNNESQNILNEAKLTVMRELVRTGQFIMINQNELPQDPKKFINSEGEYDLRQLAQIANTLGISAVLEGKVLSIKSKKMGDTVGLLRQLRTQVDAEIRFRLVAGKNSHEILNEVRLGSIETSLTRMGPYDPQSLNDDPELVRQSVRKVILTSLPNMVRAMEKLRWEGRVAMISGDRVFINAGRLSGLQVGDLLKVSEEGEEIFDPESGKFLGKAPGRMKGTLEVINYFGKDGAVGAIHSGSGFKENDLVELY